MKREERITINDKGTTIPITVEDINGIHTISVDNVIWVETNNIVHASVLFNMMTEHLTEYMNFEEQ